MHTITTTSLFGGFQEYVLCLMDHITKRKQKTFEMCSSSISSNLMMMMVMGFTSLHFLYSNASYNTARRRQRVQPLETQTPQSPPGRRRWYPGPS